MRLQAAARRRIGPNYQAPNLYPQVLGNGNPGLGPDAVNPFEIENLFREGLGQAPIPYEMEVDQEQAEAPAPMEIQDVQEHLPAQAPMEIHGDQEPGPEQNRPHEPVPWEVFNDPFVIGLIDPPSDRDSASESGSGDEAPEMRVGRAERRWRRFQLILDADTASDSDESINPPADSTSDSGDWWE